MGTETLSVSNKEGAKQQIIAFLNQVSSAGARGRFEIVDDLVTKIGMLSDQDFIALNLLRRISGSRNTDRRDALTTALSYARPLDLKVRNQVFETAATLAVNDQYECVAIWSGVALHQFLEEPDKESRIREVLEKLKNRINKENWKETRDFVVSKRPGMEGLI